MLFETQKNMRVRRAWRSTFGSVAPSALALAIASAAHAQVEAPKTVAFDVASQPLSTALLSLGRQASLSVLAPSNLVEGKIAPAVRGELSVAAALERLLAGSGLKFEFVQSNAVRIVAIDHAQLTPDPAHANDALLARTEPERVIVTGTNIAGLYPESSPVIAYTARDIARTGATTLEQFVAKLPQNLGTYSQYAAGTEANASNPNGVSSIDLRGLGVGTTLTLLNGRRMALSNSGQSADISLIPASAIARVEVLTDGASAIYGSDAVGGVVNFVLRHDFDGAESRVSYGGVTSGGMRQGDVSQSLGRSWDGGSGLVSYNFHSASALERDERDFSAPAGQGTLTPADIRHTLFATVSQTLTDALSLEADAGAAWRKVKNSYTIPFPGFAAFSTLNSYGSTTETYFGALGLNYRFSENLHAHVDVSYASDAVDGERSSVFFKRTPPVSAGQTDFGTKDTSLDVSARLEGVLLSLPAGEVRFSIGGGVLDERFKGVSAFTNVQSAGTLGRRSPYAFAEIFAPLISPTQTIPLVRRLELSLAARYTDYQDTSSPPLDRDFGDSTDPKIGLLWSPVEPLKLRGTYGTSFRAPTLTQLDPTSAAHYLANLPVGGSPGTIFALVAQAVPKLAPETAKTYTLGFDLESEALRGFRLSGTYYNIDYTNRIGSAPSGGLNPFTNPSLLPDLIYRPPSAAFIEAQLRASPLFAGINDTGVDLSDPKAAATALFALPNLWVYDTRDRNLALSKQDGFDLSANQTLTTAWGEARLGADITHIFSYKQQASPSATVLTSVNIPGQPPSWRGRISAGLTHEAFDGAISINYAGDYTNPFVTGSPGVDSWTTVDLNLSYDFGIAAGRADNGLRLNLSVQNLFDEAPPFVSAGSTGVILAPIGFDPANANPLGRLVVIGLAKKW